MKLSKSKRMKVRAANGFTLVELMIVIAIMLVVVGIAIPALRTLTKGDSVREAARTVNLFIESARSDAIVNEFGGVWLERNDNANEVTRIFKVKRPPRYSGDFADVKCYVQLIHTTPGDTTTPFDTTEFNILFRQSENSLFYPNASGQIPIRINDRIQLGGTGPWYQIKTSPVTVTPSGLTADWNVPCFSVTVSLNTLSYDSSNSYSGVTFNNYLVPLAGEINFLIERAPKISSRDYIQLPKGTFIDLKHSGFAVDPTVDQTTLVDGERLGGNEFATFDPTAGAPPAASVEKVFPVLITFRKDGSVDRVDYQVYPTAAGSPQTFTPSSEFPRSNIFLLMATQPESLDSTHNSLSDLDNLWIMISRSNGTVITADVLSSSGAATPGEARASSRRGARDGQNLTAN